MPALGAGTHALFSAGIMPGDAGTARAAEKGAAVTGSGANALHLMPARMKLCTNWRWNNRKPMSSGPEVMMVAAVITDQSMP